MTGHKDANNNKVLVTGGSGLVGAHLILSLIQKGEKVRALYRNENSLKKAQQIFSYYHKDAMHWMQQIDWYKGDILDVLDMEDAVVGCNKVYHCAAMVSFHPKDAKKMYKTNVYGTRNLVNVCLENPNIEAFAFVSSTAAVGRNPSGISDENTKWERKDAGNYAISKKQSEMEVWRASEEGLNVVIVNPCIILGPGIWEEGSAKLFSKIYRGLKFYTPGGNAFVGVQDVVDVLVELMAQKIYNQRFLLTSENLLFKDFFKELANALNVKAPNKLAKKWQANALRIIEDLRTFLFGTYPIITKESIKSAYQITQYSSEKLKKAINFKPQAISKVVQNTASVYLKSQ